MKTKEDIIEQNWGTTWLCFKDEEKKEVIENNGYYNGFNDKVIDSIEWNEQLYDYHADKGHIPYDLIGIGDNNGWTSMIESIPIEDGNYHMFNGSKIIPIIIENVTDIESLKIQYKKDKFTHYQKIETPKPPIY